MAWTSAARFEMIQKNPCMLNSSKQAQRFFSDERVFAVIAFSDANRRNKEVTLCALKASHSKQGFWPWK
jgi:hypothetical protein